MELPTTSYVRYGRQMILDGFGLPGRLMGKVLDVQRSTFTAQQKLFQSSVVVVGAGGLGCPALQYLAATGIGKLGIVDHDRVEISNLQRQILHTNDSVGMLKAESAAKAVNRINPEVQAVPIPTYLDPTNAVRILESYDVILDCTDNAPTRYLLSDVAVTLKKPLVSGAAQRFDGQLCTYNLGENGPCYRCLFPRPPAPESRGGCEEAGILGVVAGIVGILQATETIKLLTGLSDGVPTMLLYSALQAPPFRSIKLRARQQDCVACRSMHVIDSTDYVQFCGGDTPDWVSLGIKPGHPSERISAEALKNAMSSGSPFRLIDVRPRTEFAICNIPQSINIPLNEFVANPLSSLAPDTSTPTFIVCRLGNDSQIAANTLRRVDSNAKLDIRDIIGGLRSWSKEVDQSFPTY